MRDLRLGNKKTSIPEVFLPYNGIPMKFEIAIKSLGFEHALTYRMGDDKPLGFIWHGRFTEGERKKETGVGEDDTVHFVHVISVGETPIYVGKTIQGFKAVTDDLNNAKPSNTTWQRIRERLIDALNNGNEAKCFVKTLNREKHRIIALLHPELNILGNPKE